MKEAQQFEKESSWPSELLMRQIYKRTDFVKGN